MRLTLRGAAVAVLTLCIPVVVGADPVDDYLRLEMAARKIPGLALAVARDGEVVRLSPYGLANVETDSPVTADSVFAIASLDKQITAAGVLRAAELGRLDLDDPVAKWTDVALGGATIRQLLSHLSGLPDTVAGSVEGRSFTDYTSAQLLATVRSLVPVAPPGTRFLYSDAGLFLAQLATERAVGEPWWDFVRRELFAAAGMTSPVSMNPALVLPHRVSAYTLDGDGRLIRDRRLDVEYGPLYSDLGMTAGDFARFVACESSGSLLSTASVTALTTPTRLAGGGFAGEVFQWSRYGLGVGLDDLLDEPVVLHSGHSGVGFVDFPRRRLVVAVFTNLAHGAGSDPVGLALGVAGLLEPELSLASLAAAAGADRDLVARMRVDYESFLAGRPDLSHYAPGLETPVWEGAPALVGRRDRLGALESFELLREEPLDGERTLLLRARHANGTVYWRVSLDARGERITRVVWWHL